MATRKSNKRSKRMAKRSRSRRVQRGGEYVTCVLCGGAGGRTMAQRCGPCGASGVIKGNTCGTCGGSGAVYTWTSCSICGGSGTVWRDPPPPKKNR